MICDRPLENARISVLVLVIRARKNEDPKYQKPIFISVDEHEPRTRIT